MMEAGNHWLGNYPAKPVNRATSRCILPEGKVRAGVVVIGGISYARHLKISPLVNNPD